jgi:hypothetical protein
MTTKYGIIASRSGGSMFGAATAWAKRDGKVMLFASLAEAEAEAARLNGKLRSSNVSYRAAEYDER